MTAPAAPVRYAWQRVPPPVVGDWLAAARDEPNTGMVCWPDFHLEWPALAAGALREGHTVGVAIGDVDDLSGYVAEANRTSAGAWGHLAGNELMRRAGATARGWLARQGWDRACLSTFGGDEIVLAATVPSPATFLSSLAGLSDELDAALPRSVSWAVTWVTAGDVPAALAGGEGPALPAWIETGVLARLDAALFAAKAGAAGGRTARAAGRGFVTVLEPVTGPTASPGRAAPTPDRTVASRRYEW